MVTWVCRSKRLCEYSDDEVKEHLNFAVRTGDLPRKNGLISETAWLHDYSAGALRARLKKMGYAATGKGE